MRSQQRWLLNTAVPSDHPTDSPLGDLGMNFVWLHAIVLPALVSAWVCPPVLSGDPSTPSDISFFSHSTVIAWVLTIHTRSKKAEKSKQTTKRHRLWKKHAIDKTKRKQSSVGDGIKYTGWNVKLGQETECPGGEEEWASRTMGRPGKKQEQRWWSGSRCVVGKIWMIEGSVMGKQPLWGELWRQMLSPGKANGVCRTLPVAAASATEPRT